MRRFKKYKSWSKTSNNTGFFPLRILKLKKTKWKKTKKSLLKVKNKFSFLDHTIQTLYTKKWEKIKSHYKRELSNKLNLQQRYDFKITTTKIYANEKTFFINNFIKNEYRLDVMLYTLKFFFSVYEARQQIKNGFILVNNKTVFAEDIILYKGDIIVVSKKSYLLPKIIRKEFKFSFLEVDYYTQTFVILKNIEDINLQDIIYNFTEKSIY